MADNHMVLGGITLDYDPDSCTLPRGQKSVSVVETYGGAAVFSWGVILPGTKISMSWDMMSKSLFEQLDALYVADNVVQWVTGIDGKTYNVEITKLDGAYMGGLDYRGDVSMELIIMSEVTS